jgi:hypothetical protein
MQTDRIRLLVKGTKLEAARAAADRGIPACYCYACRMGSVMLSCGSQHLTRVSQWYVESSTPIPGTGFPPGTLLHYAWPEESRAR